MYGPTQPHAAPHPWEIMTNYEAHMNRQVLLPTTNHQQKTSIMLINTNSSLFVFLVLMGTLISGPIISYIIVTILYWFLPTPVVDLEQHAGIPLETLG